MCGCCIFFLNQFFRFDFNASEANFTNCIFSSMGEISGSPNFELATFCNVYFFFFFFFFSPILQFYFIYLFFFFPYPSILFSLLLPLFRRLGSPLLTFSPTTPGTMSISLTRAWMLSTFLPSSIPFWSVLNFLLCLLFLPLLLQILFVL